MNTFPGERLLELDMTTVLHWSAEVNLFDFSAFILATPPMTRAKKMQGKDMAKEMRPFKTKGEQQLSKDDAQPAN